MAITGRKKIISIVIFCTCMIIGAIVLLCFKFKNSYIFKIGDAFLKTLNATSANFKLNYKNNEDEFDITGSLEYSYKELEVLMNGLIDGKKIVADISLEKSTIAYFIETFNYWLTLDISESTAEILNKVANIGEKSIEESFPVQEILKLTSVDEKIDISKYPNKLSKKFVLKLVDNTFKKDVLRIEENEKDGMIKYSIVPNVYEFVMEFIKCSDISKKDKLLLKKELEKNKEELETINIMLSVIIDDEGYIKEFFYSEIENENIKEINLKLENINKVEVHMDEDIKKKLSEE